MASPASTWVKFLPAAMASLKALPADKDALIAIWRAAIAAPSFKDGGEFTNAEAQAALQAKVADLPLDCYQAEFTYWKKA